MKKIIQLSALLFVFAALLFSANTSFAQTWASPTAFVGQAQELQSANGEFSFLQGVAPGTSHGTATVIGICANENTPNYMLDILCDPSSGTLQDINVSTTASPQNVGYRIGGNYVLWHDGVISNIYVGVGAGRYCAVGLGLIYNYQLSTLRT